MGPTESNITAMQWRAPLIKLTQIGNPDVDGGQPTATYVSAEAIGQIRRLKGAFVTYDSIVEGNRNFHPAVECTEIHCCHYTMLVTESPETVAMLRDKAFGFEPPGLRAAT